MNRKIELVSLKLADGGRILRFSDPESGLCLEKRLDSNDSIARQKDRGKQVFEGMLERALDTRR